MGARPLRRRVLYFPNPKTLMNATPPPRLRSLSDLSAPPSTTNPLHSLQFLRRFSAPGRPGLAGFRELLACAEREKKRWGHDKRTTGEEVLGVGAVAERFERLIEGWGDGRGDGKVGSGVFEGGDEEEVELFDFEGVFERHQMLLEGCVKAETPDDMHKWMARIDKFEEKCFGVILKCRNGQKMLDELNVAKGEERTILIRKIAQMVALNQWKDFHGSDSTAKEKCTKYREGIPFFDAMRNIGFLAKTQPSDSPSTKGNRENDHGRMVGNDGELLQKLCNIDKMVEERLASCSHFQFHHEKRNTKAENKNLHVDSTTFQDPKSFSFNLKGFDAKLIDAGRKYGETKTGKLAKYIVLVACGNYNGVIGLAKAQAPDFHNALEKAYEGCFQNLHYVGRHEDRTICHPVQAEYEKTKIYLWPAPTGRGIKASRTVETVLRLAGFKDIRSKVTGCRTPHTSLNALFEALNATRIPENTSEHLS